MTTIIQEREVPSLAVARIFHLRGLSPEEILAEMATLTLWTDEERAQLEISGSPSFLDLASRLMNVIYPANERSGALDSYIDILLEHMMARRPASMEAMTVEEVLIAYMELEAEADGFVDMVANLAVAQAEDSDDYEERLERRYEQALAVQDAFNRQRVALHEGAAAAYHTLARLDGELSQTVAVAAALDQQREENSQQVEYLVALADRLL